MFVSGAERGCNEQSSTGHRSTCQAFTDFPSVFGLNARAL